MKVFAKYIGLSLAVWCASCSLVEVDNPNVTDKTFLGTPESAEVWVNGMRKQLANTLNQTVVFAEMVSDNYYNNSSLSNQVFDIPMLLASDLDIDNLQRALARLRSMAEYGIAEVLPAVGNDDSGLAAEVYFMGAYAYILGAELHVALPMTDAGAVMPAADHLNRAVAYLNRAMELEGDPEKKIVYTLGLARAYYGLGNRQEAAAAAAAVIANAPMVLRQVKYDGLNGASNLMQSYTFSSSTNTFAPLPRLDFLDPKYFHVGNVSADQKPIAILKGEEAFLIAAEAAMGNGDLNAAREILTQLIRDVVPQRPTASVDGRLAERKGTRSDYPLAGDTKVRVSPGEPEKEGLVLGRADGNITVFQVSGTSVTEADIAQASGMDELVYLLCLLRQEIFMSEGRRMIDLGIRFPVSQIEQQNNSHVDNEYLQPVIPDFIPGEQAMDDFDYDPEAGVVTIKHDMNRVLVMNREYAGILPLLK